MGEKQKKRNFNFGSKCNKWNKTKNACFKLWKKMCWFFLKTQFLQFWGRADSIWYSKCLAKKKSQKIFVEKIGNYGKCIKDVGQITSQAKLLHSGDQNILAALQMGAGGGVTPDTRSSLAAPECVSKCQKRDMLQPRLIICFEGLHLHFNNAMENAKTNPAEDQTQNSANHGVPGEIQRLHTTFTFPCNASHFWNGKPIMTHWSKLLLQYKYITISPFDHQRTEQRWQSVGEQMGIMEGFET